MNAAERESRIQSTCLLILTTIAVAAALYWLRGILVPFVLAVFFSLALTPAVELQIRYLRAPRSVAVLSTIAIAFVLLSFVAGIVSSSVSQLTANAGDYQAQLQELTARAIQSLPLERFGIDLHQAFESLRNIPAQTVGGVLVALTNAIVDVISRGAIVMIFVIFLLLGSTTRSPSPEKEDVRSEIENRIERYIVAQTAISGVTGLLVGGTLWWLGIDLAMVFGLFAFLLNFIPNLGSIVATLLPLPVVLVSPEIGPSTAIMAIAIPGAIQMVVGYAITPKVLGDSLDLHPVTVLLALMFWGALWGLLGMVLATPITAVLKILMERSDITAPVAELISGKR